MRRLRLLHTESSCGWGGQELRVLAESEGMMRRGHEVCIASAPESRLFAEAGRRGLRSVALPIARKRLAGLNALRRFLSANGFDIINTHSSTDAWLTALARLTLRQAPPMVRTRHISAPLPTNPLSTWIYRSASAQLVTTGESLRRQLIDQAGVAPERVTSVPTGLDLERFTPGDRLRARQELSLEQGAFYVAIVATLRSWKGHADLVDAIARVPRAHLLIVGDGPGRDNLHRQVAQKQLEARVLFAGHREDVVPWMQAADVIALPSFANEGVPQALMQAMACGIPVITTVVGAIGEIVQDQRQGLIVPPRDVSALAQAIERLEGSRALRDQLGQAGLAQARERFSSERMLEGMEAVYARALAPFPKVDGAVAR